MKLFSIQYPLYDVDDVVDPIVTDMDVLNDDKDDDEKEELSEDDNLDDDVKDEDEEVVEKKKEEINEDEIVRISAKALREKHPEIFKDFPQLKNTIYREQEYTKIFANPKDAEAALVAADNYDSLRDLVLSGNSEEILNNIKEVSDKSLKGFAESFLPSLEKLDKATYVKITEPVIRNILRSVFNYGKNHENAEAGKNFQNAAKVVNKAIFDDYEFGKIEDFKPKEKDDEFEEDKKKFFSKKETDLLNSVTSEIDTELDSIIGDIDPGKQLEKRPTLKAKILKDIKQELREALANDNAHMTKMNSLWAREKRGGYEGNLKDSIKTTFLSRAKVLLPEIRKKVRSEYLGTVKDRDLKQKRDAEGRDKNINIGSQSSGRNGKVVSAKEAKAKGMSAMDVLNS